MSYKPIKFLLNEENEYGEYIEVFECQYSDYIPRVGEELILDWKGYHCKETPIMKVVSVRHTFGLFQNTFVIVEELNNE